MDNYMQMATTDRHNNIVSVLIGRVLHLMEKKEVYALQSDCALVHWGKRAVPSSLNLVNISEIADIGEFTDSTIEYLEYVQPDFMLFKDNPYLKNSRGLRTAGQPDLIIEVWSDGNSKKDREILQSLYSTSDITEHWYIEQYSNEVVCYYGSGRIENQYLTNVLATRNGLQFDLRYLAV